MILHQTPQHIFRERTPLIKCFGANMEELPDQGLLCLFRYDPKLVDLASNFLVLCSQSFRRYGHAAACT